MSTLKGIGFPLAFLPDCSIITKEAQRVSVDDVKSAVLVSSNGIPLSSVGSLIPLLGFDQIDEENTLLLKYYVRRAVQSSIPYVTVSDVQVSRVESTVTITVYYVDSRLSTEENTFKIISDAQGLRMDLGAGT